MAGTEGGVAQSGPGTLSAEGALAGQLALKWVQTRVFRGILCREHLGLMAGAEVYRPRDSGALCVGGFLPEWPEPTSVFPQVALHWGCPGKLSGAKVMWVWGVAGCFVPVSPG